MPAPLPKKTLKKAPAKSPKTAELAVPEAPEFELPDALEAAWDIVSGEIFDAPKTAAPADEVLTDDDAEEAQPAKPARAPEGFTFNIFGSSKSKRPAPAPAPKTGKGKAAGEQDEDEPEAE